LPALCLAIGRLTEQDNAALAGNFSALGIEPQKIYNEFSAFRLSLSSHMARRPNIPIAEADESIGMSTGCLYGT
jgi:hypothetical protein